MSLSVLKTWEDDEVLTTSDFNAGLAHIVDNGEDLAWPATKDKDLNGKALILSPDQATQIEAATDKLFRLTLGSTVLFTWDATTGTNVNGVNFFPSIAGEAVRFTTFGSDTDVNFNLTTKGAGIIEIESNNIAEYDQIHLGYEVFGGR